MAGLVSALLLTTPALAQVQVDVNTGSPNSNQYLRFKSSAGWYHTPSSTFFLFALKTRFNSAIGPNVDRTVTAEVWSDRPAAGGTLLGSGNFQSKTALGGLGGGSFAPILLHAGVTYFFGFRNIQGLGHNFSRDVSAGLYGRWYGSDGPVFTDDTYETAINDFSAPILRLEGRNVSVVPEPMTMTLLATGLVGIGAVGYIKRRGSRRSS